MPGLEHRGQLTPSVGIVRHTLLRAPKTDIEMELAHIDAGIELDRAVRYPTLLMHVHDRQLFGLHEWMKRADALTLC